MAIVYAIDFWLGLLVKLELRGYGLDGGDCWRLWLLLPTNPGRLLVYSSTSSLATVGKPGAGWFGTGKICTGGEGAGRFGAVSKGGGDGRVSGISVVDLLRLVGGSGSRLIGLSAIIETAF